MFFSVQTDEWSVHNRLFKANFEVKFKKHSIFGRSEVCRSHEHCKYFPKFSTITIYFYLCNNNYILLLVGIYFIVFYYVIIF
jgi:hypothetical protein